MWPFTRKPSPARPVIPDALHALPHPGHPAPGETAMDRLRLAQRTLQGVTAVDPLILEESIQEMTALSGRLGAMLTDFSLTGGRLDQFSGSVEAAKARLQHTVGESPDIILRAFSVGHNLQWPALLAFADGMVDNVMVDQDTLRVCELYRLPPAEAASPAGIHKAVQHAMLAVGHVSTETAWSKLLDKLTYGSALLFVEGAPAVLVLDTVKFPSRSIGRAQSEPAIKGPQEAFNEILLTHMSQIRRHIRTSWLKFDPITLGGYTKTTVVVAHIEGLTNPELVSALKRRLKQLRVDEVEDINQLSDRILERRSAIFPLSRLTERVDWVVRDILRGKVALMVDNDPFVTVYPNTFIDFYQTTQDYIFSAWDGTLVRLIRLMGLMLAVYLLPLYIALTSVNPDLVPTKLILTIAGSRQGIPFPPVMEVIIMYIIIEVLREAANRLPQPLATTLGTVGAVVVGTPIVILTTPTYSPPAAVGLSRTAEG